MCLIFLDVTSELITELKSDFYVNSSFDLHYIQAFMCLKRGGLRRFHEQFSRGIQNPFNASVTATNDKEACTHHTIIVKLNL